MTANVVLVADTGDGVGLGHLERLLALADTLAASVTVAFAMDDDERLQRRVELRGHDVVVITADAPHRALEAVRAVPAPAAVILDGYRFDLRLQATIRENCRVVVIDDTDQPVSADIAVNPSPAAAGPGPGGADKWLRGPEYALIAKPYLETRGMRLAESADASRILVAAGGADPTGVAEALVGVALESGAERVDVAVGPTQPLPRVSAANVQVHEQPSSLAPLMATATIYLGAAGTTAVQAACVGLPAVVVAVVDNQLEQARRLESAGSALLLPTTFEATTAGSMVRSLLAEPDQRSAMSDAGRDLVDGGGCARLAAEITALL